MGTGALHDSAPLTFALSGKEYVAAGNADGRIYLLDAASSRRNRSQHRLLWRRVLPHHESGRSLSLATVEPTDGAMDPDLGACGKKRHGSMLKRRSTLVAAISVAVQNGAVSVYARVDDSAAVGAG